MSTQTVSSSPQQRVRRASRPVRATPAIDCALLETLWTLVQDGRTVIDDVTGEPIRGIEHYADLLDLDDPLPLSGVERSVAARSAHSATSADVDLEVTIRALVAEQPVPAATSGSDPGALVAALRVRERAIKATALIAQHVRDTPR